MIADDVIQEKNKYKEKLIIYGQYADDIWF